MSDLVKRPNCWLSHAKAHSDVFTEHVNKVCVLAVINNVLLLWFFKIKMDRFHDT